MVSAGIKHVSTVLKMSKRGGKNSNRFENMHLICMLQSYIIENNHISSIKPVFTIMHNKHGWMES